MWQNGRRRQPKPASVLIYPGEPIIRHRCKSFRDFVREKQWKLEVCPVESIAYPSCIALSFPENSTLAITWHPLIVKFL